MRWKLSLFILSMFIFLCLGKEQDFEDGLPDTTEKLESYSNDEGKNIEEEADIVYESPKYDSENFYFIDNFDYPLESEKIWIKSKAKKEDTSEEISKYDGVWNFESPQRIVWKNDIGLVLKSKAKHAAISAPLAKVFSFKDKPLVIQYEVTMQEGQECGGSYIKLLSSDVDFDLQLFNDKTPYTIMFGPDKCGNDVKLHFIFRHVNPINGSITEKHCRKPKERLEEPFKDKLPHLYQLVIRPDNTFQISVDHKIVNEGSLTSDFVPAVNPPREIDDPTDQKPENWDEREKIPDPDSTKPDDWDEDAPPQIPNPVAVKPEGWLDNESEMIADPNAKKPEDWDNEIDGDWEAPLIENPVCLEAIGCGQWKAPLIPNPEYKGKWRSSLIDNPNYQGKWVARKIENPDFFEDLNPFKMTPISAIGIEIWSMSSDILFDNILITDDVEIANNYALITYDLKRKYIDKEAKTLLHRILRHMNYKPGWWALYFIYVCIPFGCYAYYLKQRANEETFLNKVINYTNENTWLWGVYIVVLGTPLSFAIYTLFCTNKDKDYKSKKDDSIVNDEQEPFCEKKETMEDNSLTASPKPKKSDLEVKMPETEIKAKSSSPVTKKSVLEGSKEDEEDALIEETEKESNLQTISSEGTRKRNKPRKE